MVIVNDILKISIAILLFLSIISCRKNTTHPLYIEGDGLFDYEGNFYRTAIIGDQEWTVENLRSRIYCSGDSIPHAPGQAYYKLYDTNEVHEDTFGLYYNYLAVEDTLGLCPCGWRVSNEADFDKLINYLGGYIDAWLKMKATGLKSNNTGFWDDIGDYPTQNIGTNESGFNVQPAGIVFYDSSMLMNRYTSFWAKSNDQVNIPYYEMGLTNYVGKQTLQGQTGKEQNFFSIRCIKEL